MYYNIYIEQPRACDDITDTMPNFPKFNKTIAHTIFTNTKHKYTYRLGTAKKEYDDVYLYNITRKHFRLVCKYTTTIYYVVRRIRHVLSFTLKICTYASKEKKSSRFRQ